MSRLSKLLKVAYNLHTLARPFYREFNTVNKDAPMGTVDLGGNLYADCGGGIHTTDGKKLVEVSSYHSGGIKVILPPIELDDSGILGYHHPGASEY